MTILPKKKEDEESDSDSECSGEASPSPPVRPPLPPGARGSPSRPPEDGAEGYYHRHYEYSSSGESSPELPVISKQPTHSSPPPPPPHYVSPAAVGREHEECGSEPGTPHYYSGYNSAEEHENARRHFYNPELERQFEQALKKSRGMVIHRMKPDGACLFRAVAHQVYGDQDMHSVVRNHTMDYMMKNADYFSQFVTEDFEQYINRKRSDHSYGNNLEMQAMAEMYNRTIEVHRYSIDPINIFFGVYKTDNAPIRLSYHGEDHYNSVVDPYSATVGVGLGLAGHKPGLADQMLLSEALRNSEAYHLDQSLLEGQLQCNDRDTTYEALEEAVARESYLTWLRDQERRTRLDRQGMESTSAACVSTCVSTHHSLPPPISSSPSPHPSDPIPHHLHTLTPSSSPTPPLPHSHTHGHGHGHGHHSLPHSTIHPHSGTTKPTEKPYHHKGTTTTLLHTSSSDSKLSSYKAFSRPPNNSQRNSSSSPSLRGLCSHRSTPSPSTFPPRRSSSSLSTTHHGSARTSPYTSPHTSPHGSRRGSPRSSPRNSFHGSPPNTSPHHSPPCKPSNSSGGSSVMSTTTSTFKYHSPIQHSTVISTDKLTPPTTSSGSLASKKKMAVPTPPTNKKVDIMTAIPSTSYSSSSSSKNKSSPPPPHASHGTQLSGPPPAYSLDFESGRVLDQVPFEYSSFLDLPPSAFGLSEWEDDHILAAVLAASQQEYLEGLKQSSRGAESL